MYCSTPCRTADEESNKPTTASSWSLDNNNNNNPTNISSPIAFYPYNHFANVAMQSPRSPFMTLLPQTTPKFAAAASPRFTGSSSGRGGASQSPFALGSNAAAAASTGGNVGGSASIPFLALPQSELDLPPLELDAQKKLEFSGNLSRMDPLVSKSRRASANIHFNPLLNQPTTSSATVPPISNPPRTSVRNILESPMLNARIPPPSPRMTGGGSQDMSCAAGSNGGGLVTVAGSNAMLDDCYVSLAFNNRVRK
ncbi:hypothetical protein HDU81_004278 [Chytriomyces hyalinus]|nr:hypothetical protein HDU81_004278 [Chytriomyces hyalinus]